MAVLRRLRRLDPFLRAQAQIVLTLNSLKKAPLTGRFFLEEASELPQWRGLSLRRHALEKTLKIRKDSRRSDDEFESVEVGGDRLRRARKLGGVQERRLTGC